jgi:RHH-type rel operon transcriptional repressor/antitoxin RelB
MLSISLEPEIERRLDALAKRTGKTKAHLAQQLIEQNIEDLEDVSIAEMRLADPRPALTGQEARKALGLDD